MNNNMMSELKPFILLFISRENYAGKYVNYSISLHISYSVN